MRIHEVEVQNLGSLKLTNHPIDARDELLNDFDIEQNRPKDISFKTLLLVYICVFLALLILLPKVYISNQIYYNSKEINKMYHKYTALKEERAHLKRELERLRYQTLSIESIE
jgi:hypothetical protein